MLYALAKLHQIYKALVILNFNEEERKYAGCVDAVNLLQDKHVGHCSALFFRGIGVIGRAEFYFH